MPVVLLFAGHATRETFVEPFALFADTAAVLEAGLWFDQEIAPFLAAQRRAAIQAWPHAEAIVVPDGQHTLMWTHPRVVVDAVQRVRRRAAAPR